MKKQVHKREVPVFNASTEYQWYNTISALGDSDEGGSFCISRRRVDEAGPNSPKFKLQDVVRGAVMRGHGDHAVDCSGVHGSYTRRKMSTKRCTKGFLLLRTVS